MPLEIPTLADIEATIRRVVREELSASAGPTVLSTEQAAVIADRDEKTVRTWAARGLLPAEKRGKTWAIRRADLDSYLSGELQRRERAAQPSSADILASLTAKAG